MKKLLNLLHFVFLIALFEIYMHQIGQDSKVLF